MKNILQVLLSLLKGANKSKVLDILKKVAKYGGIVYSLIKIVNFAIDELQDDTERIEKKSI